MGNRFRVRQPYNTIFHTEALTLPVSITVYSYHMHWLKHGRYNITHIKKLNFIPVFKVWSRMRIATACKTTTIPAHHVSRRGYRTYWQGYREHFVTSMRVLYWVLLKGENNWQEGNVWGLLANLHCADTVRSVHSSFLQSVQRNELENWIKSHGI
jgi:hypothetical protein